MKFNYQEGFDFKNQTQLIAQVNPSPEVSSSDSTSSPIKMDSYSFAVIGFVLLALFSLWLGTMKINSGQRSKVLYHLQMILIVLIVTISGTLALIFSTNEKNAQQTNACVTIIGTALGYAVGSSQNKSSNSDDKNS